MDVARVPEVKKIATRACKGRIVQLYRWAVVNALVVLLIYGSAVIVPQRGSSEVRLLVRRWITDT